MALAGSGQWTMAPVCPWVGAAGARPTSHSEHKQLGAGSGSLVCAPAPRKVSSHISHGVAPRCPAASASGCSLRTGVLCGAAEVLINAAPDGELWWAHRSAAANPHMPKEITFCHYWQSPKLKLCNENKNEAFFFCYRVWEADTEHSTAGFVNGEECVSLPQTGGFEFRCQSPTVLILLLPKPYKYPYSLSISFWLQCPTQAHKTCSLKHPNALQLSQLDDYAHFLTIHVLIIVSEHRERSSVFSPLFPLHPALSSWMTATTS